MKRQKEMRRCNFWFVLIFSIACPTSYANAGPGLNFIENKNQWPAPIDFAVKIPGGDLFLQPGRFEYYFVDGDRMKAIHQRAHADHSEVTGNTTFDETISAHYLKVDFVGANPTSAPQPFGMLSPYYNYFIGSDSTRWASHANSYSGVLYDEFYIGINLKIYSSGINIKYDYIVKPYADPSQIAVDYKGADELFLSDGSLYIKTSLTQLIEKKPYAFQFINGKQKEVRCEYVLNDHRLSFTFPDGYDPCYELTIDPLLIFSTYSGSTADNWGSTATPGEKGCLYSAGVTNQTVREGGGKFPSTPGAFQTTYGGLYDIGILKYDSTGQHLVYASYLGGYDSESPHTLIMNANEELIVMGTTSSPNFPTTVNAIDRTYNGGQKVTHVVTYDNGSDMFIARISNDGTKLLGSTFLGGTKNDGLNVLSGGLVRNYGDELRGDIITDVDGNIYVSSVTSSSDFPMTKGLDTTYNGGLTDAILLKLNPDLSKIIWGTYLGGADTDASHTVKLDHLGNIFVAGGTNSVDFPMKTGGYRSSITGAEDGWIAHVKSSGDSILQTTFTGTISYDQIYFLDLNDKEEVFVYGQSNGNFPTTAGVYSNPGSGQFVQKFDNTLSTLGFSTVFGSGRGIPDISPTAFLVNKCDNLYMAGWGGQINSEEGFWQSDTYNMPVSPDAYQKTTSGSDFYLMVLTADASEFLYATYLGGTESRTHVDGGTCRFDKSGIVYHAVCSGCSAYNATQHATSDFPTTADAYSRTNKSVNCNNAAFKFDLSLLKARLQVLGPDKICMPDKIEFKNQSIGGELFEWDLGDGTHIEKHDTSLVIHQYKVPGQYTVKLKAIDDGTCAGIDSTQTFAFIFVSQSSVQNDDALCAGTSYQLKASGGVAYTWKSQDGTFTSGDADPMVSPQDTTRYIGSVTEPSGCVHKDTVWLNVIPSMKLDLSIDRIADCFSRPSVSVVNHSKTESTDKVFFDFGDGQTSDAIEVIHNYEHDGIYHVKLVGSREFCAYDTAVDIPIFLLKVPNVITPGDGGLNNKFVVQFGDQDPKTIDDAESNLVKPADYGVNVSLVVYNRWGELVYASKDYRNTWSGDGLASGVYYYEVTVEGQATCKDWLHIIK